MSERASSLLENPVDKSFFNKQPDGGIRLKPSWIGNRLSNSICVIEVATRNESVDLLFMEGSMWMGETSDTKLLVLVKLQSLTEFRLDLFFCTRKQSTIPYVEIKERLEKYKNYLRDSTKHAQHKNYDKDQMKIFKPINEEINKKSLENFFNFNIIYHNCITSENIKEEVNVSLDLQYLMSNTIVTSDMFEQSMATFKLIPEELSIICDAWRSCLE
jgi:hypothetical protein